MPPVPPRTVTIVGPVLDAALRQDRYTHVSISLYTGPDDPPPPPGLTTDGTVVAPFTRYLACDSFSVIIPINDDITNVLGTYYVFRAGETVWTAQFTAANAGQTYQWGDPAVTVGTPDTPNILVGVQSIEVGLDSEDFISIDDADPTHPVIHIAAGVADGLATLGSDGKVPTSQLPPDLVGGQVDSVVPGTNISVDDSDPANPEVSVTGLGTASTHDAGDFRAAADPVPATDVSWDGTVIGAPDIQDVDAALETFGQGLAAFVEDFQTFASDPSLSDVGQWRQVVLPSDPMDLLTKTPVTVTSGQPDFTVARSAGAGFTVSSSAGNTESNDRWIYCLPGEYTDVEVHVVVSNPGRQTTPSKLPQFGLGLRVTDTAAWTSTVDVAGAYGVMHNCVWNYTGATGSLKLDKDDVTYAVLQRQASITYIQRYLGYWVIGIDRYVPMGSAVTVAGSGIAGLDGTYTGAGTVGGNFYGITGPLVYFPSGGGADTVALPCAAGRISVTPNADTWPAEQSMFPIHMVGRVIGDRIQFRTWAAGDRDTDWTNSSQVSYRTITAPVDPSNNSMELPSSGKVGFFVNHLAQSTGTITFDLIEVRPL